MKPLPARYHSAMIHSCQTREIIARTRAIGLASLILCAITIMMVSGCSVSKPGPKTSVEPMSETKILQNHPLLVKRHELYERTGLFIGILNDTIMRLMLDTSLNSQNKILLLKIRSEAAHGIVSAASQPDVIYSQLEVLFFSRLFLEVTSREAKAFLPSKVASELVEAVTEMEKLFWESTNQNLEIWRKRVDENVKQFLTEYPDLQSIGYVNSSLYTIGDRQERNRIYGLFGINSQLANTTRSIYELNEAAEQLIFLSQIIPQISIWEFEYTMQSLLVNMDMEILDEIASLPKKLDANIEQLSSSLGNERELLSKSLITATSQIQSAVKQLDGNLDDSIKMLNSGVSSHVTGIMNNTKNIGSGLVDTRTAVKDLSIEVKKLSEAIVELPKNIVDTFGNLPENVRESADDLRRSMYVDIGLLLTAIVLSSTLSAFIVGKLIKK